MSLQINPGEYMAIVRQLADPNDTGTYYVQAKVRNARTDALLDTVNLTDRGGQRFSLEYLAPSLSSDALYISISTRVYTDSGYTTLSDAYGQEIETYLVDMRSKHLGGGGGGISADYFRKILREILAEVIKPVEPVDLKPLMAAIKAAGKREPALTLAEIESIVLKHKIVPQRVDHSAVLKAIESIVIPEHVPTDLAPVLDAIANIPEQVPTDLSPVIDEIKNHAAFNLEKLREVLADTASFNETVKRLEEASMAVKETADVTKRKYGGMEKSPFDGMTIAESIRHVRKQKT